MDPLTITLQVASGVASTINAIQLYNDYQGKYNSTDLSTLSLKIQCECISVALNQIHRTLRNHPRVANQLTREDEESAKTFKSVLGACQLTFRILEERIKQYTQGGTNKYGMASLRAKVRVVWNDKEVKDLALSLSGIARGLDLLLTAINMKSNFEIHEALTNHRASVIIERVVDDARSLRSSYHLDSPEGVLDLYMQDPTSSLEKNPGKIVVSTCVHRKNHVPQQGLKHAVNAPSNSQLEDNDSLMDPSHSLIDAPGTTLKHPQHYCDADISMFAKDSSCWLDNITFDLRDQNLTSFEPHWVQLISTNIQRLTLERNLLTSLPVTFDRFHQLNYISLKRNRFVKIPDLICPNLEVLDLSHNQLTSLPDGLADRFRGLKVFQLEHNKIKRLPYDMCDMKALLKLRIHGNPLIEPPRDDVESLRLDPEGSQYHDPEIKFTKIILKHLKLRLASTTNCPDEEKERMRLVIDVYKHFAEILIQRNDDYLLW